MRGLEVNAVIKKRRLKDPKNLKYRLGKKHWDEMYNYYEEDRKIPGVSHWSTKVGPFTILTDQSVFAVSPKHDWWATYYCAPGYFGIKKPFTEGIDIRFAKWPLDPRVVKKIKRLAIKAGVDPKLVDNIKPSSYKGCEVTGWNGKK